MTLCDNGVLTYHPSLHVSTGLGRGAGWDWAVSLTAAVPLEQPSGREGLGRLW